MRTVIMGIGAAVAGAAAVWILVGERQAAGTIPYEDARAVEQGREIYDAACASCHGADLEGQVPDWRTPDETGRLPAPPHDATGHTWHHSDELLFRITKFGSEAIIGGGYESNMIGFGDSLGDDEILAVLAYIKSTWPADVIEMHNQRNAGEGG